MFGFRKRKLSVKIGQPTYFERGHLRLHLPHKRLADGTVQFHQKPFALSAPQDRRNYACCMAMPHNALAFGSKSIQGLIPNSRFRCCNNSEPDRTVNGKITGSFNDGV